MKLQRRDEFNKKLKPEEITVGEYIQECLKSRDEQGGLGELESLKYKLDKLIKFNGDLINILIKRNIISENDAFDLSELEGNDPCHSLWKDGKRIKKY